MAYRGTEKKKVLFFLSSRISTMLIPLSLPLSLSFFSRGFFLFFFSVERSAQ